MVFRNYLYFKKRTITNRRFSVASAPDPCANPLPVTMATQAWTSPTSPAFASAALSLLTLVLLLLLCLIKKKRRMEGTYQPSAEERKQTRAAGPEKPGLRLPLPKEERLI